MNDSIQQAQNLDFKEDIKIDPSILDVEWLMQPQLFMKYAEALATAEKRVDRAKEVLDITKAELDSAVRSDPEPYTMSDKKPTEGQISNIIAQQPEFKEKLKAFNDARSEVRILIAAVRAFDQRKVALENLVRLHGQSYFAGPLEPRDLKLNFEDEARKRQARSKVYSKLNPRALTPDS